MTGIYWIQHDTEPHLAIVSRPREDRLEDEMRAMKASGIDILVSLLEPDEGIELGLDKESELAQQAGMEFVSFPIADHSAPANMADFRN